MNSINYIQATESDVKILADLRIEFLVEFLGEQAEESTNELSKNLCNYFKQALNNKIYICWLAKIDNSIVGVGGMVIREQPGNFKNPSGKVGYLLNMYTVPSHRRKSICNEILNRLISTAKEMGVTAFELHATKEGESLYQKHGFAVHTEPTYRKYIA